MIYATLLKFKLICESCGKEPPTSGSWFKRTFQRVKAPNDELDDRDKWYKGQFLFVRCAYRERTEEPWDANT